MIETKHLTRGILLFFAFMVVFSLSSTASASWDRSSLTLKPGENVVAEYANSENTATVLIIENISAPSSLLPFVVVAPSSVIAFENDNIYITFATVPQSILSAIDKDTYTIKINGLVVYLDTTENQPPSENADNIIAELSALKGELLGLKHLISLLTDNSTIQTQRFNTILDIVNQLLTMVDDLHTKVYENSDDNYGAQMENMRQWVKSANDNAWAQVCGMFVKQDEKLSAMQETINQNQLIAYAAIGTAIGLFVLLVVLIMRFKRPSPTPSPPKPEKHATTSEKPDDPIQPLSSL